VAFDRFGFGLENQISIGMPAASRILSMMPGSSPQFTKTDGAHFATQRLLADRDAELVEHPLRQVD